MKQKKKSWVKTLLSFAEPCKGKDDPLGFMRHF